MAKRIASATAALVLAGAGLVAGLAVGVASAAGAEGVELRGHGGPVQAIAVGEDRIVTGAFDSRAIVWDARTGAALRVLRFHDGGVTAVALLGEGALATGGQDGRIAIWSGDDDAPASVEAGHEAPVAALAVGPGGALASGGWDGTVRRRPAAGDGPTAVFGGHEGQVTGVAWLPGGAIASAGYDGTVRRWSEQGGGEVLARLGVPLGGIAVDGAGGLWVAGADGVARGFDAAGRLRSEVEVSGAALSAIAADPGGGRVAVGAIDGVIAVIDAASGEITVRIGAAEGPVWALAFAAGDAVMAAGADNVVRPWHAATGAPLAPSREADVAEATDGDDAGARVFRMCAACHALGPDDGGRAGPSLHGIFGRRIATAEGYDYSPALAGMDIVWSPEAVSRLFEIGPAAMTPGTKMPEQRVPNPEDRAALIEFLERETR